MASLLSREFRPRARLCLSTAILTGVLLVSVPAQDKVDLAPFVPTPQPVVDRILELARVNRNDTVYDLGCGDGRIVVTAAKRYGAKGVGVDIDPERVRESLQNAKESGVDHLVTIRKQDAMTVDLSEATVVTLYLLPESNDMLKPRLERFLKPGARVVSHDFSMTGWRPNALATLRDDDDDSHRLYLWIIGEDGKPVPSTLNGVWTWTTKTPKGRVEELSLSLRQEGERLNGALTRKGKKSTYPISKAAMTKGDFEIIVNRQYKGQPVKQVFSGKLYGNIVRGQVHVETAEGAHRSHSWRAVRQPATATGSWKCRLRWGAQEVPATLELTESGLLLQGTCTTDSGRFPITDARLNDNVLELRAPIQHAHSNGRTVPYVFRGWIEGDSISGDIASQEEQLEPGEWRAQRE